MTPIDLVTLGQGTKNLLEWASKITDAAKRLEAVNTITNLQQALLSAKADNDQLRTENFELQKEIFDLKNKIRDYEDWNKTKEQYEPATNSHGVSIFIHKSTKVKTCPNCLGKKLEMPLQPRSVSCRGTLDCHNCKLMVEWQPELDKQILPTHYEINDSF